MQEHLCLLAFVKDHDMDKLERQIEPNTIVVHVLKPAEPFIHPSVDSRDGTVLQRWETRLVFEGMDGFENTIEHHRSENSESEGDRIVRYFSRTHLLRQPHLHICADSTLDTSDSISDLYLPCRLAA
ncbi:hypothetical protein BLNAU_10479 [Blattamonas nauphoetae]|uniref:Uncharacterized protein n=1 Tax=Blattamonas nauphoetae TaxID=2049346 RepID=A0ABQ9XQD7_9EUKA|nr:hypothetical protein BLNAU_10479 [Blattamonas nauphoetae]